MAQSDLQMQDTLPPVINEEEYQSTLPPVITLAGTAVGKYNQALSGITTGKFNLAKGDNDDLGLNDFSPNANIGTEYTIKLTGESYRGLTLEYGGRLLTTETGAYEGQFSLEVTIARPGPSPGPRGNNGRKKQRRQRNQRKIRWKLINYYQYYY